MFDLLLFVDFSKVNKLQKQIVKTCLAKCILRERYQYTCHETPLTVIVGVCVIVLDLVWWGLILCCA